MGDRADVILTSTEESSRDLRISTAPKYLVESRGRGTDRRTDLRILSRLGVTKILTVQSPALPPSERVVAFHPVQSHEIPPSFYCGCSCPCVVLDFWIYLLAVSTPRLHERENNSRLELTAAWSVSPLTWCGPAIPSSVRLANVSGRTLPASSFFSSKRHKLYRFGPL